MGRAGGQLPDLAVGENVEVVMESGKFFEGFVERIVGLKAGDTTSVPITFPANHKVRLCVRGRACMGVRAWAGVGGRGRASKRGRACVSGRAFLVSTRSPPTPRPSLLPRFFCLSSRSAPAGRLTLTPSPVLRLRACQVPDLRGVEAVFDVTIKGLKDKVRAAADDAARVAVIVSGPALFRDIGPCSCWVWCGGCSRARGECVVTAPHSASEERRFGEWGFGSAMRMLYQGGCNSSVQFVSCSRISTRAISDLVTLNLSS